MELVQALHNNLQQRAGGAVSRARAAESGKIVSRNRRIVLEKLEHVDSFFARHGSHFNWQLPKAGPIAFPSLASNGEVEKFCHELITAAGVLLLPGTVYGVQSNFRIGFGRKNLPECLEKLEGFLLRKCA